MRSARVRGRISGALESATAGCAFPAIPARIVAEPREFFTPCPGLIDTVHMNLHRMLALTLLCVGSFVASGPAIACCAQGTPTQDCCPSPSHEAGSQSDQIGSPFASQSCCAVAAQTAVGTAFDVTQNKVEHQADAPFSLVYLATLSTTDPSVRVAVSSATPAFPILSPVYLRTGRLRL